MAIKKIYRRNVKLQIIRLLPTFLRKETTIEWLEALLSQSNSLSDDSISTHEKNLRRSGYNSGRKSLEKLLNDLYDPTQRGIRLTNISTLTLPFYTFFRVEGRTPFYTYFRNESAPEVITRNRSEFTSSPGLRVRLPWYLKPQQRAILNTLEGNLVAGVSYQLIQSFPILPPSFVPPPSPE